MTLRRLAPISLAVVLAGLGTGAAAEPAGTAATPPSQAIPKAPRPASIDLLMAQVGLEPAEYAELWDAAQEGGLTTAELEELLKAAAADPEEFKRIWREARASGIPPARLMRNLYVLFTADELQPAAGGGHEVARGEAPYQAEMYQPWDRAVFTRNHKPDQGSLWILQHMCGGSLIAPGWTGRSGWVATAAHCIDPADGSIGYRIRLGTNVAREGTGFTYRIDQVIWHPGYVKPAERAPPARHHDIALVHFVADAKTPAGIPSAIDVTPIPLDRGQPPRQGQYLAVSGWALVGMNLQSQKLMEADLYPLSAADCNRRWRIGDAAHYGAVCAIGRIPLGGSLTEQPRSCRGDSGGPLVNRDYPRRLIGIVSWNIAGCRGDPDKPGVYTRVAAYADWIGITIARREAARAAR
ncbi:MAG TPA: serine protease [Novosphingobium sp.]|nr:serine protease [Novosphingobium sp.]